MPEPVGAFTPPDNPGDTLRRVLVIQLGPLGAFVQAMGAMRIVRMAHPSARITLLTTQTFEPLAKACPYFDIVEIDQRPEEDRAEADLIRRIKQAGYDMVYDFENSKRTASFFAGLGSKKPKWSGVIEGASHQHRNPDRATMQNFDRVEEQLRHAGLTPETAGDPGGWVEGAPLLPSFGWVRSAFRDPPRFQPEYFSLYGPYVLLIPGGSEANPGARWPVENFIELARWFADHEITPVIVGDKADGAAGVKIERKEQRAKSIVGRTDLFQLATLSEKAVMTIGADTGHMHLAAAAGAPGICLFAQDWTTRMREELNNVWSPQTRLGRAAPRGSHMFVLYAPELENIGVWDVQHAAVRLGVLPPSIEAPPRPEPEIVEDEAVEEEEDVRIEAGEAGDEPTAQALAESDDS